MSQGLCIDVEGNEEEAREENMVCVLVCGGAEARGACRWQGGGSSRSGKERRTAHYAVPVVSE